jgi:hypothetical protein
LGGNGAVNSDLNFCVVTVGSCVTVPSAATRSVGPIWSSTFAPVTMIVRRLSLPAAAVMRLSISGLNR